MRTSQGTFMGLQGIGIAGETGSSGVSTRADSAASVNQAMPRRLIGPALDLPDEDCLTVSTLR